MDNRMTDLLYICCQPKSSRKGLLQKADSELVRCIHKCCSQVLDGSIPITKKERTRLRKYKRTLRALRDAKTQGSKKKVIVQSGGGFLLSLIPAVVGALASLIR